MEKDTEEYTIILGQALNSTDNSCLDVFIGDAANMWKKAKPLEQSTCLCTPENGCNEDCLNRFMLYECDESNCNVGAEYCTNRSFTELHKRCKAGGKYNIGVEVMKTIDRGYGIRANRTFDANQIIVEYTGEIITQDECDERMNKRYKDAEVRYVILFSLGLKIYLLTRRIVLLSYGL